MKSIELGRVEIETEPDAASLERIDHTLRVNGFELIDDKKRQVIEKIKTVIIGLVHYDKEKEGHLNLSDYLAREVGYDYSYLSNLFSSAEGITIEKYLISQKIEKTKELLVYEELTLSEIANQLGYSSTQHLSAQFKKVTGMNPSRFKNLKEKMRIPLDQIGK